MIIKKNTTFIKLKLIQQASIVLINVTKIKSLIDTAYVQKLVQTTKLMIQLLINVFMVTSGVKNIISVHQVVYQLGVYQIVVIMIMTMLKVRDVQINVLSIK